MPVDGVIRSLVLPGFQFRVSDLYQQPEHESLRADPVYADFVLPGWRTAEERATAEMQARLAAEQQAREAMQTLARLQAQPGQDALADVSERPPLDHLTDFPLTTTVASDQQFLCIGSQDRLVLNRRPER